MKRLSVHAVFGLLVAAAAATAAVQGLRLQQARQLNAAIEAASQAPVAQAAAASPAPASGASAPTAAAEPAADQVARDAPREVRLARATALAQAGAYDVAFKAYSGLIEPGRVDALGRHALYNLGNMVLRQGLGLAPAGGEGAAPAAARSPAETGPLIELAKQRYRDLLRADPGDWDARYNLERALRAAPEEQAEAVEETNTPVERRQVMLRGLTPGDLP